jgi:hypothetical protein
VGELAQDAEQRREADAAADQDEAAGGAAGRREGAVRAVEIGGRAGGDRADAGREVAGLLDGELDARAVGGGRRDREGMLGQAEGRVAEIGPGELAGGEVRRPAALGLDRDAPHAVGGGLDRGDAVRVAALEQRLQQIDVDEGEERDGGQRDPEAREDRVRGIGADGERVMRRKAGDQRGAEAVAEAPELVAERQAVAPGAHQHEDDEEPPRDHAGAQPRRGEHAAEPRDARRGVGGEGGDRVEHRVQEDEGEQAQAASWWKRMVRSMPTLPETCRKRPESRNCASVIAKATMTRPDDSSCQKPRPGPGPRAARVRGRRPIAR